MRALGWVIGATLPIAIVSGCMEPQVAPELPSRPSAAFSMDVLASGLANPMAVAPLGGGEALITLKEGRLLRLAADSSTTEVSGVPDIYYPGGKNSQAGLFDVVPARDFAGTGRLFLSYAYGTDASNGTALSVATLDGNRLTDVREIFRGSPKDTTAHYGARVVALPDGTVALSTGDGFTYREKAQALDSTLGKVVRVNADGTIPADNPFGSAVWSLGHRNVQGLALDSETGQLWEHEHGPRGGDELNIIEPGANYGWPVFTTGTDYNGLRISPYETADEAGASGFTPFVHEWTPSVAPSGLVIYRGDLFPEWNGDALVGALAGQSLRRVDLQAGRAVGEEILLGDLGARIRDVREAPDGSVWVVTNGEAGGGRLLRIAPKGGASES